MNLQKRRRPGPGQDPGGLIEVQLENGASSEPAQRDPGHRRPLARTSTCPARHEYRNKGVAYCPHCDGPLFKGKRVAVIGGGNSGVEAAIDLAGMVAHVTLIEFDSQLRADAVLQRRLASLPNVRIVTSAQTTEVLGDGKQGHRPDLQGPQPRPGPHRRPGRRVRADRPGAQHRVAEGRRRGPDPARRDRGRSSRRDLAAGRVRRRRRDDHALQADHHRHGRGREGVPCRPSTT